MMPFSEFSSLVNGIALKLDFHVLGSFTSFTIGNHFLEFMRVEVLKEN